MEHMIYNNIPIEIERKKIKNMYLKILPPDGKVLISAPLRIHPDEIYRFLQIKYEWMIKQRQKMQARFVQNIQRYISGEEIYLWGKKYTLKVILTERKARAVPVGDEIHLYVKLNSTPESRARILNQWYKEVLQNAIPELIGKWEQIIGVKVSGFAVRDMKTRWGSCNIRTGKICLNLRLVYKRPICLEYVIVHELVHLLEASHNQVFKNYMDQFLPNWRTIKKELNN